MSQILEIANCSGGATKTKLMYTSFLPHDQLKEYLRILIESELLIYDSTMRTFKITEKGITFLQAYNQIDQILKEQQI